LAAALAASANASISPQTGPGPVLLPGVCYPAPSAPVVAGTPVLSQWALTLPVNAQGQPVGKNAAYFAHATLKPPYLTAGPDGSLKFYAPAVGATTPGSTDPRTELARAQNFQLVPGAENTLKATVAVTQVPNDTHKIIIGQLHVGAGPFVTLRYDAGTIRVIADQGAKCTLLTGVALGQRFSYQITQNGYELRFAASTIVNKQTVTTATVTLLPTAYRNGTAYFSAGDYEQSIAHVPGSAGRVTFYGLETITG
jgi:hypothetical protein